MNPLTYGGGMSLFSLLKSTRSRVIDVMLLWSQMSRRPSISHCPRHWHTSYSGWLCWRRESTEYHSHSLWVLARFSNKRVQRRRRCDHECRRSRRECKRQRRACQKGSHGETVLYGRSGCQCLAVWNGDWEHSQGWN